MVKLIGRATRLSSITSEMVTGRREKEEMGEKARERGEKRDGGKRRETGGSGR